MGICCVVILLCYLLGMALLWARQDGKKTARLEALKREAREAARVQDIKNYVDHMSLDDVRRRLHKGTR